VNKKLPRPVTTPSEATPPVPFDERGDAMPDSTQSSKPEKGASSKPPKPYPSFPLGAGSSGHWQKRINSRLCYFGAWGRLISGVLTQLPNGGEWREALQRFNAEKDALYDGRSPLPESADARTVRDICNAFMRAKTESFEQGDIGLRMLEEYRTTCEFLIRKLGRDRLVDDLKPRDFEKLRADISKRRGPAGLGNQVVRVKSIFKYALAASLISKQVVFGPQFKGASKRVMREHRNERGKKLLPASQIRSLISSADDVQLKCWILLGVNCGLGPTDIVRLPNKAIDFEQAWLNYPRPKNGIKRESPLWAETVSCLKEVLASRPKPTDSNAQNLVFLRKSGKSWEGNLVTNSISLLTTRLMKQVGCYQPGNSHYTLRHVFATVGAGLKDVAALSFMMGHSDDNSMLSRYIEEIDPSRLTAISNHVRSWLFDSDDHKAI
jgi:integrase